MKREAASFDFVELPSVMGTSIFFSQKMEGKGKRDTGHVKFEQCVCEVL